MIWSWNGSGGVNGFKVYRVDGANRVYVGAQARGAEETIYIADVPPDGTFNGKCYAVTAYAQSRESDMSPAICVGPRAAAQMVSLPPSHWRSISYMTSVSATSVDSGSSQASVQGTTVITNKITQNSAEVVGTDYNKGVKALTGELFDLSAVKGRTIRSAKLKLKVLTTYLGADGAANLPHTDHHTSCIAKVGVGQEEWWNYTDSFDGSVVLDQVQRVGPIISFDVTKIVRGWVQYGDENYGFVLMGPDGDPACLTTFANGSAVLYIEYY